VLPEVIVSSPTEDCVVQQGEHVVVRNTAWSGIGFRTASTAGQNSSARPPTKSAHDAMNKGFGHRSIFRFMSPPRSLT
jgi:hypothetical protein